MRYAVSTAVLCALVAVLGDGCAAVQKPGRPRADATVAADGTGDYETISMALNNAESGWVIAVGPGTYEEEVEFPEGRHDITLLGSGPGKSIIDAGGEYAAVTLRGRGHTIAGFTIAGAGSHGVYAKDGHHEVHHCLVYDNGDRGIFISTMSGRPSLEISHCTIADNLVSGIYSVKDDPKTSITDCIIAFNRRGIVADEDESGMQITYNCVHNEDEDFDRVTEGEENSTRNPKFVDHESGDYRLASGSPCLGTASDKTNRGCF